jgi:hypothetical protein
LKLLENTGHLMMMTMMMTMIEAWLTACGLSTAHIANGFCLNSILPEGAQPIYILPYHNSQQRTSDKQDEFSLCRQRAWAAVKSVGQEFVSFGACSVIDEHIHLVVHILGALSVQQVIATKAVIQLMICLRQQRYHDANVLQDVYDVLNYTFDWALNQLQPIAARHFSLPNAFPVRYCSSCRYLRQKEEPTVEIMYNCPLRGDVLDLSRVSPCGPFGSLDSQ